MNTSPVISDEVLQQVETALLKGEHYMVYNGSLYFIGKEDVHFFDSEDAAYAFVADNFSDHDNFHAIHITSIADVLKRIPYGEELHKQLATYIPTAKTDFDKNPLYDKDGNAFTDALIDHSEKQQLLNNKTNVMNTENFDYLKDQVKYLGFGEGLQSQLERKMKEGMPDFQLTASHEFGKDKMEAVLHFKKSEKPDSDRYFFNKYDATLLNEDKKLSQTFWINNKGQSITFKESCNLLNGRCVFKELTPKEGPAYKAWVQLDPTNKDDNGNAKMKHFNSNYGFDPVEAVNRIPLKELAFPDQTQTLIASLEKGNRVEATLLKDGKEQKVGIEANPQFKTLNLYDKEGKKLFMPAAKQEVKYGQAPADQKKTEKQELLTKKTQTNGLIEKKATKKTRGQALA